MNSTNRSTRTRTTRCTVVSAGTVLALLGGVIVAGAAPALAAPGSAPKASQHRVQGHATAKGPAHKAAKPSPVSVQLGPATSYTRAADGTITRTR